MTRYILKTAVCLNQYSISTTDDCNIPNRVCAVSKLSRIVYSNLAKANGKRMNPLIQRDNAMFDKVNVFPLSFIQVILHKRSFVRFFKTRLIIHYF